MMTLDRKEIRVMLVDDDEFSLTILGESLQQWSNVLCVSSVAAAISNLEAFDPNVVVTDLDFNAGPDGGQLLQHLAQNYPWIGRVVLSSHSSPTLAIGKASEIPAETIYLVKADVAGSATLREAVYSSIKGESQPKTEASALAQDRIEITKSQAQVLQLIAAGRSNSAIAAALEISVRAAEGLVQRTFAALGIKPDDQNNARVLATRLWIEGRVRSK